LWIAHAGTVDRVSDTDALVARYQAGYPDAFAALYRTHRADVVRIVRRLAGPHELDDIVQDVFVQVYRSLKDFRKDARFTTWLYRVTVNVVLMRRRARRCRPALVELDGIDAPEAESQRPDEQLARRQRAEALVRLLNRLSEKKRTAYVLHEIEGMAPSEIARVVGAPVLTVRTRLFYARRELAQLLRQEPPFPRRDGSRPSETG